MYGKRESKVREAGGSDPPVPPPPHICTSGPCITVISISVNLHVYVSNVSIILP